MENTQFEDNTIKATETVSQSTTVYSTPVVVEKSSENVAEAKKPKKTEVAIKIVDTPNRVLPGIIQEALNKNFSVLLNKKGYFIEGFYGIKHESGVPGFIFAQETTENNTLVFFDAKGHKHYIKDFNELVSLNSFVWGQFYKSEEFKKPNAKWFGYMLELGVLNITPSK